jgi:hypothetical protein
MEGTPEPAGSHLAAMDLKVAPFLDPHPGLFFARDPFKQALASFLADRQNPAFRQRVPCINDPAARQAAVERCLRHASAYAPASIQWLSVANEHSPTSCNSAFDFCSCEHCARAFAAWLQRKYGTLEALGRSWGFPVRSWQAAVAPTTDQAREAYRRDRDANLAAWFDFRRFSDDSFLDALGEVRHALRQRYPDAPLKLSGLWPPGTFGAQDWERVCGEYDILESYDECGEFELARSFCEGRCDLASTYPIQEDRTYWDHSMWMFFIHGLRVFLIENFRRTLDPTKEFRLTEAGRRMAEFLRVTQDRLSPMLASMARCDDPILVLHSSAAQARAWVERMFNSTDEWAGQPEGWVHDNETYLDAERSWYRVIEDAGRQFRVISARVGLDAQPGRGRVLILPLPTALSDAEIEWTVRFLRTGGLVIHESPIGRFDGDLRLRAAGKGIHEQAASLARPGEPIAVGEGRLVCLATPVQDYARQRLHTRERLPALRDVAALFDAALPAAIARIESIANERVEITVFGQAGARVLAIHRNDVRIMFDPRGDRPSPVPVELILRLAEPACIQDILSGREWPLCDHISFTLDPVRPTFLRLTPPASGSAKNST